MTPGNPRSDKREASSVEVVAWALAGLGGVEDEIHLEDIAAKAFALKPGAFRWDLDNYAHFIDKDKVRVSLTDAAKAKYGELTRAVGRKIRGVIKPTDWWVLTPAGILWVQQNSARLSSVFGDKPPSLRREVARRLRERLSESELYEGYSRSGRIDPSPFALADLVECSPDASSAVFRARFEALDAQTRLLGDDDLGCFVNAVANAFQHILGSGGDSSG
jgi:hypothetical protein